MVFSQEMPSVSHQNASGLIINGKTRNVFVGSYDDSVNLIEAKFQWTIGGLDNLNGYNPNNVIPDLANYSHGNFFKPVVRLSLVSYRAIPSRNVLGVTSKRITIYPTFFSVQSKYSRFALKWKVVSNNLPSVERFEKHFSNLLSFSRCFRSVRYF